MVLGCCLCYDFLRLCVEGVEFDGCDVFSCMGCIGFCDVFIKFGVNVGVVGLVVE